jgi:rRNA maturation endonuclease Nob1
MKKKTAYAQKKSKNQAEDYLVCLECDYIHPEGFGLEEGDICPECDNSVLIKV